MKSVNEFIVENTLFNVDRYNTNNLPRHLTQNNYLEDLFLINHYSLFSMWEADTTGSLRTKLSSYLKIQLRTKNVKPTDTDLILLLKYVEDTHTNISGDKITILYKKMANNSNLKINEQFIKTGLNYLIPLGSTWLQKVLTDYQNNKINLEDLAASLFSAAKFRRFRLNKQFKQFQLEYADLDNVAHDNTSDIDTYYDADKRSKWIANKTKHLTTEEEKFPYELSFWDFKTSVVVGTTLKSRLGHALFLYTFIYDTNNEMYDLLERFRPIQALVKTKQLRMVKPLKSLSYDNSIDSLLNTPFSWLFTTKKTEKTKIPLSSFKRLLDRITYNKYTLNQGDIQLKLLTTLDTFFSRLEDRFGKVIAERFAVMLSFNAYKMYFLTTPTDANVKKAKILLGKIAKQNYVKVPVKYRDAFKHGVSLALTGIISDTLYENVNDLSVLSNILTKFTLSDFIDDSQLKVIGAQIVKDVNNGDLQYELSSNPLLIDLLFNSGLKAGIIDSLVSLKASVDVGSSALTQADKQIYDIYIDIIKTKYNTDSDFSKLIPIKQQGALTPKEIMEIVIEGSTHKDYLLLGGDLQKYCAKHNINPEDIYAEYDAYFSYSKWASYSDHTNFMDIGYKLHIDNYFKLNYVKDVDIVSSIKNIMCDNFSDYLSYIWKSSVTHGVDTAIYCLDKIKDIFDVNVLASVLYKSNLYPWSYNNYPQQLKDHFKSFILDLASKKLRLYNNNMMNTVEIIDPDLEHRFTTKLTGKSGKRTQSNILKPLFQLMLMYDDYKLCGDFVFETLEGIKDKSWHYNNLYSVMYHILHENNVKGVTEKHITDHLINYDVADIKKPSKLIFEEITGKYNNIHKWDSSYDKYIQNLIVLKKAKFLNDARNIVGSSASTFIQDNGIMNIYNYYDFNDPTDKAEFKEIYDAQLKLAMDYVADTRSRKYKVNTIIEGFSDLLVDGKTYIPLIDKKELIQSIIKATYSSNTDALEYALKGNPLIDLILNECLDTKSAFTFDDLDDLRTSKYISDYFDEKIIDVIEKRASGDLFNVYVQQLRGDIIKPSDNMLNDDYRMKEAFKYNNIPLDKLQPTKTVTRTATTTYGEYYDDLQSALPSKPSLNPLNLDEIIQTDLERGRDMHKFSQKFNGKHGQQAVKILRKFKYTVPVAKELIAFSKKYPKPQLQPVYHGTGNLAASFLFRYGFQLLPSGAAGTAGKGLGQGMYFTDLVEKAAQYMNNGGWGRNFGEIGYMIEGVSYLGEKNTHYRATATNTHLDTENRGWLSPEYCVQQPLEQFQIVNIYECLNVTKQEMKQEVDAFLTKYPQEKGTIYQFEINESGRIEEVRYNLLTDGLQQKNVGLQLYENFIKNMSGFVYGFEFIDGFIVINGRIISLSRIIKNNKNNPYFKVDGHQRGLTLYFSSPDELNIDTFISRVSNSRAFAKNSEYKQTYNEFKKLLKAAKIKL